MQRFMFDSNAFDKLLELKDTVDWVSYFEEHEEDFEFLITAIQVEELADIPDYPDCKKKKRVRLFLCLCCMNVKLVPTIGIVGYSRVGFCTVANEKEQDIYTQLLNENSSNIRDAMIGAAAYREGCTVIADDKRFIKKLKAENIPAMTFEEFCETLGLEAKN